MIHLPDQRDRTAKGGGRNDPQRLANCGVPARLDERAADIGLRRAAEHDPRPGDYRHDRAAGHRAAAHVTAADHAAADVTTDHDAVNADAIGRRRASLGIVRP